MRKLNVYRTRKTVYVISKLSVIVLMIAHAVGVIFYIIDIYILAYQIYQPAFCWLTVSTAYDNIIGLPWFWQYYYSLYWGINTITTISYGDIAPLNPWQLIYTTAMFCFGFMVYGYVVNQIIQIVLWTRQHKDKLRADMVVMDIYMDKLQIPQHIRYDVRNHLQFLHKQQKNRDFNIQTIMRDKLPEELRYQLVSNAYSGMNNKIIQIFECSIATKFLFNLTQKKYTSDQPISNQGQRALSLNYLHKGKIQLLVLYGKKCEKIYQTQSQSEFLGNYELFSRRRSPFSVISKTGTIVYSIQREKVFLQINAIQQLRQKYKEVQYEVMFKNNFKRIFYQCYFCKQEHDWTKCPVRFYIHTKPFKMIQQYKQQGSRILRKRYHTLNDRSQLMILISLRTSSLNTHTTIQKRIARIKQKQKNKHNQIEIDIAFDWKYFDAASNLSRKKQGWNQKVGRKIKNSTVLSQGDSVRGN